MPLNNERFTSLAKLFRSAREDASLSQGELAKKLKFSSPQIVSNWERGLCAPPMNKLAELSEILNVAPNDVMSIILEETSKRLEGHFKGKKRSKKTAKRA